MSKQCSNTCGNDQSFAWPILGIHLEAVAEVTFFLALLLLQWINESDKVLLVAVFW